MKHSTVGHPCTLLGEAYGTHWNHQLAHFRKNKEILAAEGSAGSAAQFLRQHKQCCVSADLSASAAAPIPAPKGAPITPAGEYQH